MLFDAHAPSDVVLIEAVTSRQLTVEDLYARQREIQARLGGDATVFLAGENSLGCVRDFLSLVETGIPVFLLNKQTKMQDLLRLIELYEPTALIGFPPVTAQFSEVEPGMQVGPHRHKTHDDLCVLLSTSGTTGSSKFVRLSKQNVLVNATQIVKSLGITQNDRGVTSLPIFYSFGMSIITSHAAARSPVLVTDRSVMSSEFWADLETNRVTFLAGVPSSFEIYRRVDFNEKVPPTVRALTQAGGRMPTELISEFAKIMENRGGHLFVMYGQTEASPRIACLPPSALRKKIGSVGLPLEGGRLSIEAGGLELKPNEIGEIVYRGPNVMLGYAESQPDLELGNELQGILATGDLGYLDDEGFLFVTGRTKRMAKVAGIRVSLDEVETRLSASTKVVAIDGGSKGLILFAETESSRSETLRREFARVLGVPASLVEVRAVSEFPLMPSGKVDYRKLAEEIH